MENEKQYYNLLIAKKTEKLVTAIYLISQFLKDKENIKTEIRKEANILLKNINLLAFDENEDNNLLYKESLNSTTLLISFLSIAKDTNLISKMNVNIVVEALRALENILIKKQFEFSKENLLIVEEDRFLNLLNEKAGDIINKNTSFDVLTEKNIKYNSNNFILNNKYFEDNIKKENSIKIIKDKNHKGQELEEDIKDIINNNLLLKTGDQSIIKKRIQNKEIKGKAKQNKERKESRREQILGLFSGGVEVSINDISKKIEGCSLKTIQRELNDLVSEEKLKRIGEKRWSKYILNI